ncbi:MAG: gliding motility-associated C-terminal domain-containing protein [Bacteroidia bacterium]|nr:gliding motility-associated C-terminal domain-containing protein [Bacteroidia bacterium]MDW8088143.1 gliding motility-associated C-terminal domain-containing protein [Bacteroidia bacterium]
MAIRYLTLGLLLEGWSLGRHIAGADLYYRCVDPEQNLYEFELWLYRDCTDPEGANYDNPIVLHIFRGDGSLHTTYNINLTQSQPWNPGGVEACFLQRPRTCLEEGVYRFRLTLPPRLDGYYIAWARCCRNATITNLQNPLYMGITYLARIPPMRRAPCNSSPRFRQRPPFFLCAGREFHFDHQATDPDGDSLVYAIVAAYHSLNTQGQGAMHPSLGGSPVVNSQNPMGPPPYQTVTYAAGYSATQPFGPDGICAIDPATGLLRLYAPNPGLYVVAIAVHEYRNGEYLGETRRDMQFYVAPCRAPSPPPQVNLWPGNLPHSGDTVQILAAEPFCFLAEIRDTAPPLNPPATLSYTLLPDGLNAQPVETGNPLRLQICGRFACSDTGRLIQVILTAQKTELCGVTTSRDTLWVRVLTPPSRTIRGSLTPPELPRAGGIFILPLDSTACAQFFLVATPSHPPPNLSLILEPLSAQVRLDTTWRHDTLFGRLCYRGGCEGFTEPVRIRLRGVAETNCPPFPEWHDSLLFQVPFPTNPPPQVAFLPGDSLRVIADSLYCLRLRIVDTLPPSSRHTLYLRAQPPLVESLIFSPHQGRGLWEAEVCLKPSCSALSQTIQLIAEVRDSVSCAEVHRRYDTLWLQVESRPVYPLDLQGPPWTVAQPFYATYQYRSCFRTVLRDTAPNGGTYEVVVNAPFAVERVSQEVRGDSVVTLWCFRVPCEGFSADSLYALVVTGTNQPPCALPPPAARETLWIRPQALPQNRPPLLQRNRLSPWAVEITGDSLCYEITVIDPDTFALLSWEGIGPAFQEDFFYGANFHLTALEGPPLRLRLCAQLNCYLQGQPFEVVVCVRDTTSCEPERRWRVCDTLRLEPRPCMGTIPNVFTPNGDGINDFLAPYNLSGIARWRLSIWDRWGQLVFQGGWQEPWRGQEAVEGTYFYLLELHLFHGDGPPLTFQRAGSVTLLR